MANLKLSSIDDDKPVKVTVDLPAALHRDLVAYASVMAAAVWAATARSGEAGRANVGPVHGHRPRLREITSFAELLMEAILARLIAHEGNEATHRRILCLRIPGEMDLKAGAHLIDRFEDNVRKGACRHAALHDRDAVSTSNQP